MARITTFNVPPSSWAFADAAIATRDYAHSLCVECTPEDGAIFERLSPLIASAMLEGDERDAAICAEWAAHMQQVGPLRAAEHLIHPHIDG